MTLPQIEAAVAAVDRQVRQERIAALVDLRHAWADDRAFKEHVRRLQQEDRPTTNAAGAPARDDTPRVPLSAQTREIPKHGR